MEVTNPHISATFEGVEIIVDFNISKTKPSITLSERQSHELRGEYFFSEIKSVELDGLSVLIHDIAEMYCQITFHTSDDSLLFFCGCTIFIEFALCSGSHVAL